MSDARPIRVLTIEGGGVRGIIPTRLLTALESLAGAPISDLFDVLVGTSTGGMLALGLVTPGEDGGHAYPARNVGDIYTSHGQRIFPKLASSLPRSLQEAREWWSSASSSAAIFGYNPDAGNARYSPEGIEEAFELYFGDRMLSEALVDVVVTSYDLQTKSPVLFKSRDAKLDPDNDLLMRDAARATSAAPTYFPPLEMAWEGIENRLLVDGGVYAKNPAMIGYIEGVTRARERGLRDSDVMVVSMGTGRPRRTEALTYKEFVSRSWLKLAEDVFRAAEDGQAALHDQVLTTLIGDHYWRFQTVLAEIASYAMDDVSDENVNALKHLGDQLVGERLDDLNALTKRLLE
ncbi:MAG: patatin-like phospholipase family protein [Thermoanaerobaculales bacterium]|nr:patatin-like phospholipase family protein [Thermoanaerobaculales bacterium]